jgi:S-methylmethionine-dependent homocysteine/selenocysteine methylase
MNSNIEQSFEKNKYLLMEGALGERLKREYHLFPDEHVALAKLVYAEEGRRALQELWGQYITIARKYQLPFLATTPTRRANQERIERSGEDSTIIHENVKFLRELQISSNIEMYVGGLMGFKGDAYTGEGALSRQEAYVFHSWQANAFFEAGVDFLYAGLMPDLYECIGMAEAMAATGLPYIISFTIQKDGRLIDGTMISKAIEVIDHMVKKKPLCYMANCVHPLITLEALSQPFNRNDNVRQRFQGIQANTSPLSYEELDHSKDIKSEDQDVFAEYMLQLVKERQLKIIGGCCGTDHRHLEAVAQKLVMN